jgi:hypothetical protein
MCRDSAVLLARNWLSLVGGELGMDDGKGAGIASLSTSATEHPATPPVTDANAVRTLQLLSWVRRSTVVMARRRRADSLTSLTLGLRMPRARCKPQPSIPPPRGTGLYAVFIVSLRRANSMASGAPCFPY